MARKRGKRMLLAEQLLREAGAVRLRRTRHGVLWKLDSEIVMVAKIGRETGDPRGAKNTLAKVKRMVRKEVSRGR